MYEAFYKFSSDPFKMSPDHRFAYPHESYTKGRNYLEYGLLRGEGLVVITGLPGTGKSTVIEDLLSEYGGSELEVARIQTTQLEVRELLRLVAYAFGINAHNTDKATLLMRLEEYLNQQYDSGKRVLLIIDEAQNLSQQALEELRLLTNVQRDNGLHFQIFLLGQPQLQGLIRAPGMEQLRQRIIASCHFEPLSRDDTRNYIQHRLTVAGWHGDPQITDQAFELIHRYSGGIPRKINMLTSRLLIHGAVDERHRLDADEVREVITELPPEMLEQGRHAPRNPPGAAVRSAARSSAETVKKYERWQQAYRRPPKPSAQHLVGGNEAVDLHAEPGLPDPAPPPGPTGHEQVDTIPILTDRVRDGSAPAQATTHEARGASPPPPGPNPPEPDTPPPAQTWPRLAPEPPPEPLPELELLDEAPRRSRRHPLRVIAIIVLILLGGLYAGGVWLGKDWRQLLDDLPQLTALKALDIAGILGPEAPAEAPGPVPTASPTEEEAPPPAPVEPVRAPTRSPAADLGDGQPRGTEPQGTSAARVTEGPQSPPAPATPARAVTTGTQTPQVEPPVSANEPRPHAASATAEGEPAPHRSAAAPASALEAKIAERIRDLAPRPGEAPAETPASPRTGQGATAAEMAPQGADAVSDGPPPGPTGGAAEALAEALQTSGFVATPQPDSTVKVELRGGVPFAAGQTGLDDTGRRTLDRLMSALRDHGALGIKVVGHTDQAGIPAYNLHLSRQRAIAVSTYLIGQGVPAARVTWEGRGESEPLVPVKQSSLRSPANRRIDIYLTPAGEGESP